MGPLYAEESISPEIMVIRFTHFTCICPSVHPSIHLLVYIQFCREQTPISTHTKITAPVPGGLSWGASVVLGWPAQHSLWTPGHVASHLCSTGGSQRGQPRHSPGSNPWCRESPWPSTARSILPPALVCGVNKNLDHALLGPSAHQLLSVEKQKSWSCTAWSILPPALVCGKTKIFIMHCLVHPPTSSRLWSKQKSWSSTAWSILPPALVCGKTKILIKHCLVHPPASSCLWKNKNLDHALLCLCSHQLMSMPYTKTRGRVADGSYPDGHQEAEWMVFFTLLWQSSRDRVGRGSYPDSHQ